MLQTSAPYLLIVRLEIHLIKCFSKTCSQELLKVLRFRLWSSCHRNEVGDKSLHHVFIKHIGMILYRIRYPFSIFHRHNRVPVGFRKLILLIKKLPKPIKDILSFGIKYVTTYSMIKMTIHSITFY